MKTLKLSHPKLTESVDQVLTPYWTESKIRQTWLKRYGKKVFSECSIELVLEGEQNNRPATYKKRQIKDVPIPGRIIAKQGRVSSPYSKGNNY